MSSINSLSGNYLQQLLLQQLSGNPAPGNNVNGAAPSALTQPSDSNQLSPLARLVTTLQQLQQSDPAKYKQVTQQIASNLQNAAQTAQQQGNTAQANQLNQLASDFTNASQSGQLPAIQDLAQAIGGHHHHHHHAALAASSNSGNTTGQTTGQLFSNGSSGNPTDPLSIITGALTNAGVSL